MNDSGFDLSFPKFLQVALIFGLLLTTSCQDPNAVAMQIGQPSKAPLAIRAAQTRNIAAADQATALVNITQTLQDLGFTIVESSAELGVVTGSKARDAEEAGQVAGQIAIMVVFAALGTPYMPVWDKAQDIHVTATVAPTALATDYKIRVSFDRYMTNNHGEQWRTEIIQDPEVYQQFFSKLQESTTLVKQL